MLVVLVLVSRYEKGCDGVVDTMLLLLPHAASCLFMIILHSPHAVFYLAHFSCGVSSM